MDALLLSRVVFLFESSYILYPFQLHVTTSHECCGLCLSLLVIRYIYREEFGEDDSTKAKIMGFHQESRFLKSSYTSGGVPWPP